MDRPSRCTANALRTTMRGLLRPTSTPQEPLQTGQPPFKRVLGPRAGAQELGWWIYWSGVLLGAEFLFRY